MTDLEKKRIKAYLTNFVPVSLRGEKIEQPSDFAIKDYVTNHLSVREHSLIAAGPYGPTFTSRTNEALRRIFDQSTNRPLANGRVATGFLDFAKHEVRNTDVSPRRFKDDEE